MNHPRMAAALRSDSTDACLFAEVGLSDELDVKTMFTDDGHGMIVQFQAKLIGSVRVIEDGETKTAYEACHGGRASCINRCTR